MYIFWPHRDERRLNHFLRHNLCDLGRHTPLRRRMNAGDEAVFCITTADKHLVWARAKLAGPVFELPEPQVKDREFPLAARLVLGSVLWRVPPRHDPGFPWEQTSRLTPAEFTTLTSGGVWQPHYPHAAR